MPKTMLRRFVFVVFLAVMVGLAGSSETIDAQSPTPTPMPQVIVVTATPGLSAAPPTFWGDNGKAVIGGLTGLIFGGILVWVLKPAFEKLGTAFAEALGKLGSGWGFKKRYLTHLIEEHKNLNIRGLRDLGAKTNAVELEHVYVSLQAQSEQVLGRRSPSIAIGQALAQHRRLVILGAPGSGKTTLLKYLALTYARKQVKQRLGVKEKALPIFVPLRWLKQVLAPANNGAGVASQVTSAQPPMTFPAYLTQYYVGLGMPAHEDFFTRALEGGRCVVLLDGLDEVADETERRQMSKWVDRLVALYPDNRYIVTSRPPGYEGAALTNGFDVLRVRDFTEAEVRQFARNWYLAVELAAQGADVPTARRRARDAARDLVAAISANPNIRKLAVNPMLLTIVALVHRHRATLPKQRVALYSECVDVLLGHWDAAKDIAATLSPGEKRAVLQPIALMMHGQGRREISRRALQQQIAALLPTVGGKAADAAEFLDEVRDRSGLLVESGLNNYEFSHFTFQEYLCAREIVEASDMVPLVLPQIDRARLHRTLDTRFDEEELRTLCFRLRVDYDNLPGRSKKSKARELTTLFDRQGQLEALAAAVEQRDDIALSETPSPEIETPYKLLLQHAGEGWWQEVFLLYAGMTDATSLIKDLSGVENLTGLEAENRLLLAGRCVAEAVRLAPQVRDDVRMRLQDIFATCTGDRFVQVGQVLAEIAGEDSVAFFLRVAHEDAQRRDVALDALAEMAHQPNETLRERVIERLIARLHDDVWQADSAIVLARLWYADLESELRRREVSSEILLQILKLPDVMELIVMVAIPAGEFLMGDEKRKVHVDAFRIDKFPVTQRQYKRFIDANPEHRVPYVDSDWAKPYNWDRQARTFPPDKADYPVVLVSWHDAVAYAEWAGKRLPTEEEWEKAARGTDGRVYPWGDDFDSDRCNTAESGIGGTTLVGRYSPQGDSPYGCVDMAGNVWEWTASEWSSSSKNKVLRGGSWWYYDRSLARSSYRYGRGPVLRASGVGFRCVVE